MRLLAVLCLLLVATPAAAYSPVLTPDLVRQASTFYFNLNADAIPVPSEWAQALPQNQGAVMVVTPFIRLAMGLATDEFIPNHQPASTLSQGVVDGLNQYFENRLLLYVQLNHVALVPPDAPKVEIQTAGPSVITPKSVRSDQRLRMVTDDLYATRFLVEFALSDGIKPADTIRVTVRAAGRPAATLIFNLARMR
ncbi:MAG: hypothetical protein ACRDFT_00155 [bacterium]